MFITASCDCAASVTVMTRSDENEQSPGLMHSGRIESGGIVSCKILYAKVQAGQQKDVNEIQQVAPVLRSSLQRRQREPELRPLQRSVQDKGRQIAEAPVAPAARLKIQRNHRLVFTGQKYRNGHQLPNQHETDPKLSIRPGQMSQY
jgi:hypothetical protein